MKGRMNEFWSREAQSTAHETRSTNDHARVYIYWNFNVHLRNSISFLTRQLAYLKHDLANFLSTDSDLKVHEIMLQLEEQSKSG
jgi:hypothetical protein